MHIEELHDLLYEFLCTLDDVCRREKVRWFLDAGTELGSIREKDFIAWDDDIDIKVMFDDYPRFREVMKRCLPEHLHIAEPMDLAPAYYDMVVRIYDDRYLVREETEEDRFYGNVQNHIGTDVFLICHAPEGKLPRKWLEFRLKVLYALGFAHRFQVKEVNYTPFVRLAAGIVRVVGKAFPASFLTKRYFAIMERTNRKNRGSGEYIYANFPPHKVFWTPLPAHWYESTAEGEIRGRKFPIPGGYDEEMTFYYGDYMKPPRDRNAYVRHLSEEELKRVDDLY